MLDGKTIHYASNADDQQMDLYAPDGTGKRPVFVLVHGGAFRYGDQKMELIQPIITTAVAHGYVVASLDYRKSDEATFPGALADVKAAVRYLRAHADELGADTGRLVIGGESAGAYLSLMTALTPGVTELDGDVSDNLGYSSSASALVAFYPPVQFYTARDEYRSWGDMEHGEGAFESRYLGVDDIYANKAACDASYWETYKGQLPVDFRLSAWVQVGDEHDTMVPYTQSENLAKRLSQVEGVNVRYEQIAGAGHMDPVFYSDDNLTKLFDWLKDVLEP